MVLYLYNSPHPNPLPQGERVQTNNPRFFSLELLEAKSRNSMVTFGFTGIDLFFPGVAR